MEDYIMREIDKLGKVIEAILLKIGVLKESEQDETIAEATKIELAEQLDLDIDALLEQEKFIETLTQVHGFSHSNLEKFAELLFDMRIASPDRDEKAKITERIFSIYDYLKRAGADLSFTSYMILEELGAQQANSPEGI